MSEFEKLAEALHKKIGVNARPAQVTQYLDTGFAPLNKALSNRFDGGLPVKRIIEIYGPESSGKTAIATNAMAAAQRMGGIAAFCDHERSFAEEQGERLGLSLEPGRWLYQMPETYERSLEFFSEAVQEIRKLKMIPIEAPICWVFDSLASMVPEQQFGKNFTALNMNDTTALSRVTSQTMKQLPMYAESFNVCIIFLNQTRTTPGVVFGDPITTPGGKSLKFYASIRLQLGAARISTGKGEDAEIIGQQVTGRVMKNKITRPFLKAKWRFLFREDGSGFFDAIGSLLDFLVEKDIIKSGDSGRITWLNGKTYHRGELVKKIAAEGGLPVLSKMLEDSGVEVEHDTEAEKQAAAEQAAELAAAAQLEAA